MLSTALSVAIHVCPLPLAPRPTIYRSERGNFEHILNWTKSHARVMLEISSYHGMVTEGFSISLEIAYQVAQSLNDIGA